MVQRARGGLRGTGGQETAMWFQSRVGSGDQETPPPRRVGDTPRCHEGQAPPGNRGAPGSAGATGSRGSSREAGPVGRCRDRLWAEGRPSRLEPVPLPSTASLLLPELPGLQARCHSLTRQANKGVVSTGPNPRPLFPPRWGSGLGAPQPSSALRARPAPWGSADSGPNPLGAARPSR